MKELLESSKSCPEKISVRTTIWTHGNFTIWTHDSRSPSTTVTLWRTPKRLKQCENGEYEISRRPLDLEDSRRRMSN